MDDGCCCDSWHAERWMVDPDVVRASVNDGWCPMIQLDVSKECGKSNAEFIDIMVEKVKNDWSCC